MCRLYSCFLFLSKRFNSGVKKGWSSLLKVTKDSGMNSFNFSYSVVCRIWAFSSAISALYRSDQVYCLIQLPNWFCPDSGVLLTTTCLLVRAGLLLMVEIGSEKMSKILPCGIKQSNGNHPSYVISSATQNSSRVYGFLKVLILTVCFKGMFTLINKLLQFWWMG